MNTGHRIHEEQAVIDNTVSEAQRGKPVVRTPAVRVNCRTGANHTLDYRKERLSVSAVNKFHVADLFDGIVDPQNPAVSLAKIAATVVFRPNHHRFVQLDNFAYSTGLL